LAAADHDHVEVLGRGAVETAESFECGAGFYEEIVHGFLREAAKCGMEED
jgi:hypothetical protein